MVLLLAGSVDALEGLCCPQEEQAADTVVTCCDLHLPSEATQPAGQSNKNCPKTCCSVDVPYAVFGLSSAIATGNQAAEPAVLTTFQPKFLLLETLVSHQLANGPPLHSTSRLHKLLAVFLC